MLELNGLFYFRVCQRETRGNAVRQGSAVFHFYSSTRRPTGGALAGISGQRSGAFSSASLVRVEAKEG